MRVLLIVPPFGNIDRPNLGVHILQSCARAHSHTIDILYSNIAFAAQIGDLAYVTIATYTIQTMIGERIMGLSSGSLIPDELLQRLNEKIGQTAKFRNVEAAPLTRETLAMATETWLDEMSSAMTQRPYDVIGFSSTFEQTNAMALLSKRCRAVLPNVTLVAGGANCEGEMALAIKRLIPEIDFIFSGESEHAFTRFLDQSDHFAGQRIIDSLPNPDITNLPKLDYSEFFTQFDHWLPGSYLREQERIRLSYETSRGCWWGQKHHCTFCGLNGNTMGYREKKPAQVLADLAELSASTGVRYFGMTDNIMPVSYFTSLLPALAEADLGLDIFYEQKANISLEKVIGLKAAGINSIQPGIEALQDDLLRLMKKGTSGKQNIALLRYAHSVGVSVAWNMLSGFPGDLEEWYEETLKLIPLLTHLEPPTGLSEVNFDRFSPYFEKAAEYGITNLRPLPSYQEAFPNFDQLSKLACHFTGSCNGHTIENSEMLRRLQAAIDEWRGLWEFADENRTTPCLEVVQIDLANYLLIDTRPLPDVPFMQQISADQASVALGFQSEENALTRWGEERRVCVKGPNGYIPLACATPEVLQRFEQVSTPDLQDAAVD